MTKTKIEWADRVWNPVTGCTPVSAGCAHCYAERIAKRFWKVRAFGEVQCHEERLDEPTFWRKPARIFVNSMSDLFHPDVEDEFILRCFWEMDFAKQHTYMILTKRPERMMQWCKKVWEINYPPLPNVWLGVSVEDQKTANERIPLLLNTPAAVRFVSVEPMLGPIDLVRAIHGGAITEPCDPVGRIDWVICGGESGPGARPMHPDWVRSVRDQCQAAEVLFFFKQWGEWAEFGSDLAPDAKPVYTPTCKNFDFDDGTMMFFVGKARAGRILDGRTWEEFPEVNG